MRGYVAALSLGFLLAASCTAAQTTQAPPSQRAAESTSPDYTAVNCSSFISDERVPDETLLISGEESNVKVIFARGDYVYVNKGSAQGMHVGDRLSVVRPVVDDVKVQWFKWQDKLMKAMGTVYKDSGQLVITTVHPNVSIAQVTFSCDYMQRGDLVRPYQDRPSPPFRSGAKFDHFAPVSGKPVGMVVVGQDFSQLYGKNNTVFVNLGNAQGVKVGDYIRFFRYQGSLSETAPNTKGYQYELFGFGSTPTRYEWNDIPREILGEGIVINNSRNSSSVFITYSRIEAYAGDYVEVE